MWREKAYGMSDGEVLTLCESPACRPLRMLNKKLSWIIKPHFLLLLLQLPKHPHSSPYQSCFIQSLSQCLVTKVSICSLGVFLVVLYFIKGGLRVCLF